ncbi:YveK family protein [Paenibacillus sp. CAU 1782]
METKRSRTVSLKETEKEINLREVFLTIRKRVWLIILITGILTALGILYNSRPEPQVYASSTRIIIAASSEMMSTVRALVREPIVLNEVIQKLDLNTTPAQLRSQIGVNSVDSSLITVVSVMDSDPERAADIANATVETYRKVAADTLSLQSIRLLTPAQPEPVPINSKSNTIIYIAFLTGLILSISLSFLLHSLDESIRSENDIENRLGLNMLGQVSVIKRRHSDSGAKKSKPSMVRSETFGS